jgi:hypothetical protein
MAFLCFFSTPNRRRNPRADRRDSGSNAQCWFRHPLAFSSAKFRRFDGAAFGLSSQLQAGMRRTIYRKWV